MGNGGADTRDDSHRQGRRRTFAPWTDPTAGALVRFDGVRKQFSEVAAVERVSLDIFAGEFFALLGPSGCGKTTLLRLLAGLDTPDEGRILLDGKDIALVPPYRRPINMMFQNYALFPHLTVEGNVAFGLKQEGLARSEITTRVEEMLALVRLEGLAKRKPHQLSGGQRQRVALARSLVKRPRVLLLDEPLAALDKKLRGDTQFELMQLQERLGLTFIIVTHDQQEAMTVADRIGVMDHGRLIQVGTPPEIYERPNSRWVADFIGEVNLIEGRVVDVGASDTVIASAAAGRLRALSPTDAKPGDVVWVALRPEKVRIGHAPPPTEGENCVVGQVGNIGYLGELSIYKVRLDNGIVMKAAVANVTRLVERPIGWDDRVWLSWAPEAAMLLTR
ncbi:MAG: ABC transporter ATP-binding protein [Hyphomicrobiales bacterium]|jgi:putrescine transport system ATP-binding protein|nr:ABC transporter ATP-binding protein [Hyphomicrobiales bacterium]